MLLNGDLDPERALRNLGNLSDFGDDMLRISGMMMGATDGGTFDGAAWMYEPKKQELPGYPSHPYGARGLNDPWPDPGCNPAFPPGSSSRKKKMKQPSINMGSKKWVAGCRPRAISTSD
jgi:hypothetical protein